MAYTFTFDTDQNVVVTGLPEGDGSDGMLDLWTADIAGTYIIRERTLTGTCGQNQLGFPYPCEWLVLGGSENNLWLNVTDFSGLTSATIRIFGKNIHGDNQTEDIVITGTGIYYLTKEYLQLMGEGMIDYSCTVFSGTGSFTFSLVQGRCGMVERINYLPGYDAPNYKFHPQYLTIGDGTTPTFFWLPYGRFEAVNIVVRANAELRIGSPAQVLDWNEGYSPKCAHVTLETGNLYSEFEEQGSIFIYNSHVKMIAEYPFGGRNGYWGVYDSVVEFATGEYTQVDFNDEYGSNDGDIDHLTILNASMGINFSSNFTVSNLRIVQGIAKTQISIIKAGTYRIDNAEFLHKTPTYGNIHFYLANGETAILNLVNSGLSNPSIWNQVTGSGQGTTNILYSLDFMAKDKNGNGILYPNYELRDIFNNVVFSESGSSGGAIYKEVMIRKIVSTANDQNDYTYYGPFTLTITASHLETISFTFEFFEKTKWDFVMKRQRHPQIGWRK